MQGKRANTKLVERRGRERERGQPEETYEI